MTEQHASKEIIDAVRNLADEDYGTIGELTMFTRELVDLVNQIPGIEPITNPYEPEPTPEEWREARHQVAMKHQPPKEGTK